MELPPVDVVPSGSLKERRCLELDGRLLITRFVREDWAPSRPWIRGVNSRMEVDMRLEG